MNRLRIAFLKKLQFENVENYFFKSQAMRYFFENTEF
jgi:hypothetical protein